MSLGSAENPHRKGGHQFRILFHGLASSPFEFDSLAHQFAARLCKNCTRRQVDVSNLSVCKIYKLEFCRVLLERLFVPLRPTLKPLRHGLFAGSRAKF